jgi:hypothetical protein
VEWLDRIGTIIGAGVTIFVSVNLLFFKSDDFFSKEFKEDVSLRLLCLEPPDSASSWPELFGRVFDRIFKKRSKTNDKQLPEWRLFISWRTFLLSSVASFLAVVVVVIIGQTTGLLATDLQELEFEEMYKFAFWALVLNVAPDYLSLIETRFLLRWLRGPLSLPKLVGFISIDIVATAVVFLLFTPFLLWLIIALLGGSHSLMHIYEFLLLGFETIARPNVEIGFFRPGVEKGSLVLLAAPALPFGVFFCSTFFTSVWLWLFGLSHLVITLASRTGPLLRIVKYVLPIDDRPFRSIGFVAGLIAMVVYWAFALYQWLSTTVA